MVWFLYLNAYSRGLIRNWAWDLPDVDACPLAACQVPFKIFGEKETILGCDSSDLFQMPSSWWNELLPRNISSYCL